MESNLMNISKIESFFDSIIDNVVSNNTFYTHIPKDISDSWQDMVLVDLSQAIEDMKAYGYGSVLVWLYAKPFANGRKNVPVLSKLETKLNEVIESVHNNHYSVMRITEWADYDEKIGWHCNIVKLRLFIV
jgi:hypothetical protein